MTVQTKEQINKQIQLTAIYLRIRKDVLFGLTKLHLLSSATTFIRTAGL